MTSKIKYTLTGSSQILDKIPEYLVKNILPGLAIALTLLSCISFFLFRNWKIIPIVTFTNILPLTFVAGIMGMFGIFLKTDTAIIFSVSFGMSVDNAINYINRYRTEAKKNLSVVDGLRAAFLQIAKPMTINTFVLIIGFMSLMFSDFGSIFYIGLLITLVLIFGLISNLSLLPILISILVKEKGNN
ncbi:MAG: MMPL family transporter [Saprospiraceae bacterium]|nr:MMPL family transporter [Candidatus Vicinibacter affinis]